MRFDIDIEDSFFLSPLDGMMVDCCDFHSLIMVISFSKMGFIMVVSFFTLAMFPPMSTKQF